MGVRSLYTGVLGLKAHQTKIDVISNNIANVNTTGFKRGRVNFQDMFSQTIRHAEQAFDGLGGLNPLQVGLGTTVGSIDTLFDEGPLEVTGKNDDLAIEGNGFFIVNGGGNRNFYTRDGNLNLSPNYDLVMANNGYKLQGWAAQQDVKTGNFVIKDDGIAPDTLNLIKFLKKAAHQTNFVKYVSNLDARSQERDIVFANDILAFKDTTGTFQKLTIKFHKENETNWSWSALDDDQGEVASGSLKTDDDGKVIETLVNPLGIGAVATQPFFTYDPDGAPTPATATALLNATTNIGNGTPPVVIVDPTIQEQLKIQDEVVSVILDGGDPDRALSYRVVGSERGFIGSGFLGGTGATITGGAPVVFDTPPPTEQWTLAAPVSFDISQNITNYGNAGTNPPAYFTAAATVTIPIGVYSGAGIAQTINTSMRAQGILATAFYDSNTKVLSIVGNDTGSNRSLTLANGVGGDFADLGLALGTVTGTGGSNPKVYGTLDLAAQNGLDLTVPGATDVSFKVFAREVQNNGTVIQRETTVTFPVGSIYSTAQIVNTINSQMAANLVNARVNLFDRDNNGVGEFLEFTGNLSGSGEYLSFQDVTANSLTSLGLPVAPESFLGTAPTSAFSKGGLSFNITEGGIPWRPNEALNSTTTAAKGQADSVNINAPFLNATTLEFAATTKNAFTGQVETFQIQGGVEKGAIHSTNITVYDSLGAPHNVTTRWEHVDAVQQKWNYEISLDVDDTEMQRYFRDPANGVLNPDVPTDAEIKKANTALLGTRTGTLYFKNDGRFDKELSAASIPSVTFTPLGSNPLTISLDMELVSQFEGAFSTAAEEQDGFPFGDLIDYFFERDGTIKGVYSNGQKQPIGQVALARFVNPMGLEKMGHNIYDASANSGLAVVGKALTKGRGSIAAGTLEGSNVSIAEEFTQLIIAQRAFQANSRVITTSDQILQEVVNLKQ